MNQPLNIAIPVYNGEKYIIEALQSIADQTIKVDNIIVCDNRSNDNTTKIVQQFFNEHKQINTKLIVNEINIGSYKNFVKCMELRTTGYLLILGSDDRLKPDALEKQLKLFAEHPDLAIVGGNVDFIDQNGAIIQRTKPKETYIFNKGEVLEFMKKTNFWMQHSTVLLKLDYTRKIGVWDIKYIGCDERFYANVLKHYPIAKLGDSLVEERIHSEQITQSENLRFSDKIFHFKENLKVADFETSSLRRKALKKEINKWISDQCISISKLMVKQEKRLFLALRYWLYGLLHNPGYFVKLYLRKMKHIIQKVF